MRLIEDPPDDLPAPIEKVLGGWHRASADLDARVAGYPVRARGDPAAVGLLATDDARGPLLPGAVCGNPVAPNKVVLLGGEYLLSAQVIAQRLRGIGVCVIVTDTLVDVVHSEALAAILTSGSPDRIVLIDPTNSVRIARVIIDSRITSRNAELARVGASQTRFHVVDDAELAARRWGRQPDVESMASVQPFADDVAVCITDILDPGLDVAEGWRSDAKEARLSELQRAAAALRR